MTPPPPVDPPPTDTGQDRRMAALPGAEAAGTFLGRWVNRTLREGVLTSGALLFTIPYFRLFNQVRVQGDEVLDTLPRRNVIFVSNHQTYFLEAVAFFDLVYLRHEFPLDDPVLRFSAAEETMRMNPLTWLMKAAGGVTLKRRHREGGQAVNRPVDLEGVRRIIEAIHDGWLLHFPTGTTRRGAPVRPGMARLLHDARAVVVPVRVGGFRRLLFFKQMPGRLFRRCRISVRRPMDLTAFYDAPFTEEAGEEVRLRVETEIYGRTMTT